ncbi:hypothetical protein SRABI83_00894 [Arthrobacter sp. Bi83]|uniref:GntR family transcriptional regulator n=1 Tax=Arthrobacter sp. Bi83 TaxID=2822353 RepID=UPI001D6072C3|nr:GntR family transcriptional regulator [Arthrobacter sp. Bi83]CAH0158692.1 hypothetical protein SRABI83_00894 [Arthrobacter sp. Bi83]
MKVSRTVVREALMLLEEDGLIRAHRGVGRFVSDTLPRIGIKLIRLSRRSSATPDTRSKSSASKWNGSRQPNSPTETLEGGSRRQRGPFCRGLLVRSGALRRAR